MAIVGLLSMLSDNANDLIECLICFTKSTTQPDRDRPPRTKKNGWHAQIMCRGSLLAL